ncbi:MAG: SDR family oxidoreductase [Cucumibacter sp.]
MAHNRVAVITGATSGIGRAVAVGMAKAGYRLALCGRRSVRLEETIEKCGLGDDRIIGRRCDVTDHPAVRGFFTETLQHFGRIDVVFNNAGRFPTPANFGDTDIIEWRSTLATNLFGAFYVALEAFRTMRDQTPQGGRIINNGSISAQVPRPHAAPYNVSKSAITGLTKSISLDGRPYRIACGQIDIGNTASEMTEQMATGMLQANGAMAPEPRMEVKAVVDAILYMSGLPLEANVQFMTVMATNMPFIGRG